MRIKTAVDEARRLVLSIPHKTCARAADEHWIVSGDGDVRAQSALWLFCWAKTGMNSENARLVALEIFNRIMPVDFSTFDSRVPHEYAREARYTSRDIEEELSQLLSAGPTARPPS